MNEILLEFSNEKRYQLFKSLFLGAKRHNQLEKELKIPGSEISRHLKRLFEKNIITKNIDNSYELTNIGKIFYKVLDIFEISIKHQNFFNMHELSSIPIYLILQLGDLHYVEVNNKTLENIEYWSNLVKTSEEFIYAISDQLQNSLLPVVEKK